ncbi:MAG: asparaginase [Pseudomonadota bacterium]
MSAPTSAVLAALWRGGLLESVHTGAVAVCTADGTLIEGWGDPDRVILPRSACKMIQALPLVESGAADAARLGPEQLALACASHVGAAAHTDRVLAWLNSLGAAEDALRCGAHDPSDAAALAALAGGPAGQRHNNCSGKHAGFVTLSRHLGAGPEYVEIDHPVQRQVRLTIAEVCGEEPAGYGIDGCSAPNFAVSLRALAAGVARFAVPDTLGDRRGSAARRLVEAMIAHPLLVAGETRPTTQLMRAAAGRAAVKSGAEGVFVAILPERGLGLALKVDDGAERAARAAVAALLARYGAIDPLDPAVATLIDQPQYNASGRHAATLSAADILRPSPR